MVAGARTPAAAKASAALGKHFHSTEQAVATYVIARLKTIQRDLFTRQPFRINCPPASDAACHQNEAFVAVVPAKNENEINLCSRFFERGEPDRASTIIHEFGHTQLGLRDDQKLVDRGYKSDAYYFYLTTGQALTNAESYAMLAREIATGSTPAQGFIADTLYNCPKEWNRSVSDAISTARAWNHTAAVKTVGREQFSLPYKRLDTLLTSSFEFKCVTDAGGRCSNTVVAYWYFFGALRICPSFLAQATADDRAQSILAALYGYKDMMARRTARRPHSKHAGFTSRARHPPPMY